MKPIKALQKKLCVWCITLAALQAYATPADVSTPRAAVPPNIVTTSNRPMLMLAASKDHSLFGPIYTDFEDLDGDGIIDTTFKPSFKYYGYFDSSKCYAYNTTDNQFNPASLANIRTVTTVTTSTGTTITTNQTVNTINSSTGVISSSTSTTGTTTSSATSPVGTVVAKIYNCPNTQSYWSGNFLNWSSMTRLDIVRKMLYGGKRSTDITTNGVGSTVLERAKLNFDAHSFVKYYRGTDIRDYTPFTTADLTKTTGSNPNVYAGLSICNLGTVDSTTANPNPPIMRMVKGNVRFWSTVEVRLCQWRENYTSGTFGPKLARYYQDADKGGGGIAHEITIPSLSADGASYGGIGPELTVRVKVCDPAILGEERCQAFPSSSITNYKPYGLFQEFGYAANGGAARAEFGVITGSYDLNYTAGALRKNMGDFADEINPTTGVFCHSASSGCAASLASPDGRSTGVGAIKAFDAIILNGRTAGSYGSSGTPSGVSEGTLSSWGNPIGEMLVQALQYYSYNGTSPTPTNPSTTSKDVAVGAPVTAWADPLSNTNATRSSLYGNSVCRPLNVLLLSNSALSFDGQAAAAFRTLANAPEIDTYTNRVGAAEGFDNTLRSVGSVAGGYGTSCSAKTVGTLSQVSGICPEAPAMGGTYEVAGAALYGNTNKIRTLSSPPSDLATVKDALKVKTLAASLTGGAPRIDIPVPGTNPTKYVYITPESVQAGGAISAPLTFASISSSNTYGAFIVTWNDVLMGGDYDMDITGFIRYDLVDANGASNANGPYIKITTDIPGVCGGAAGTHGFSVIGVTDATGTSKNGRYLTHQHFSSGTLSGMPATSEYLCGDTTYRAKTSTLFTGTYADTVCNVTGNGSTGDPTIPNLVNYCTVKNIDFPVSYTFKMVGETDALIKDPLFYAAKYGDFDSSTKNANGTYTDVTMPTTTASWDNVKADGSPGSDGVPDGYFLARRPDLLEQQLRKALDSLAKSSNSAPASSSRQLATDGFKYVAKFDSTTVSGNIEAYQVDSTGEYKINYEWRAGQLLRTLAASTSGSTGAGNARNIITNYGNPGTGVTAGLPFRWASLPDTYKTQMTTASTNHLSLANASIVVDYLRGDQSKEAASTGLRERSDNLLGPIVNATPWVQSAPAAFYAEAQFPGYRAYVEANKTRSKILWVSSNDGMLHAFNATTGAEIFAYVPGTLANRLAEIPMQRGGVGRTRLNGANFTTDDSETLPDSSSTVWAYVDGSPFTADIQLNGTTQNPGAWKTYAFSSLGRGGKAFVALDATTPTALAAAEAGSNPANVFKWQFTSDDDSDLGYVVNDVAINVNSGQANPVIKLNNGRFAVLLNNGYKSTNGKAVLYLLYVDGPSANGTWVSGTNYIKIVADVGTGNGLSPPTWVDLNNDGTADVVYAGDLKGNMWKFDLSSSTATDWGVAYKSGNTNLPLFKARTGTTGTGAGLPITTAPEFAYPAFDGLIITFATGNAFDAGDFPKTTVTQRMYGIWDRPGFGTGTSGRTLPSDLTTLVSRTYQRLTSGLVVLTGTASAIDWLNKDGWYFDFPGSSEMVLSDPDLSAGVLTFTAVRPKSTSVDNCNNTPNVTLYTIDPISGKSERNSQGETTVGSTKVLVSGTTISDQKVVVVNDRTNKPHTKQSCNSGDANCTCTTTAGVTKCEKDTPPCGDDQNAKKVVGESTGVTLCYSPNSRVQWREVPGLRTY